MVVQRRVLIKEIIGAASLAAPYMRWWVLHGSYLSIRTYF